MSAVVNNMNDTPEYTYHMLRGALEKFQKNISELNSEQYQQAKIIADNKCDVKKICLQFNTSWNHLSNTILLTTINNATKQEVDLLFMNLIKDGSISLIAPLKSKTNWKIFGYKYFNPEHRDIFAELFKKNYLATDETKATEYLSQIFV